MNLNQQKQHVYPATDSCRFFFTSNNMLKNHEIIVFCFIVYYQFTLQPNDDNKLFLVTFQNECKKLWTILFLVKAGEVKFSFIFHIADAFSIFLFFHLHYPWFSFIFSLPAARITTLLSSYDRVSWSACQKLYLRRRRRRWR